MRSTPFPAGGHEESIDLTRGGRLTSGDPAVGEPSLEQGPLGEIAEEFLDRRLRGERPSIDEYAERHPELADQIRAFLPALLVVEDLKPGRGDETGDFARPTKPPRGALPERLGDYRVVREVGRGGMGVVYEAEQESLGRRVALKALSSASWLDPKSLARFHREAKAAARLHHTNIVPVFGVGEAEGVHYYVMQFIAGAGLDQVLDDVRRLQSARTGSAPRVSHRVDPSVMAARSLLDGRSPEPIANVDVDRPAPASPTPSVLSAVSEPGRSYARGVAHVGVQVADALEYAHEQGVLHRDIKPGNILLDVHGTAWVTDFGLAKAAADDDLTHTGDIIGTIRYMAPERFHGRCDARSDVYALGLTLYELLARRPAFDATDRNALIRQVGQVEPARLRRLDATIPRDLETIVHKAIEKDPAHRYVTAGAMAGDLRCVLEDRPIRARRSTSAERVWRWSRRNPATAALGLMAALAMATAAAVGWAGYVITGRALAREEQRRGEAEAATRHAQENFALSLSVFSDLFERLAPSDALPTPELGLSVRNPASRAGPAGAGHRPKASDAARRPPGALNVKTPEGDRALLQSLLTFYERFAARNATDPRLQAEAAWAYRRAGVLNERLGRAAEAETAYAHAINILEDLARRFPRDRIYRLKLVETYDIADPWTADAGSLEVLERRLERAESLIDALAAEAPGDIAYDHDRIHVYAKRGVTLQRLNRPREAEDSYRKAIAIAGGVLDRLPRDGRSRYDRATTRHALAVLLLEEKRDDEARTVLNLAADEVVALARDDHSRRPSPDLFDRLAASFASLGDAARAEELRLLAEWAASGRNRGAAGWSSPPPPPGEPTKDSQ